MKTRLIIGAALIAAAAFGALIAGQAAAQSKSSQAESSERPFSKMEEDEIRMIVREYLAEHPEVIIEAINIYAEREREADAARALAGAQANLSTLLDERNGFITGAKPASAKVAVIEFFDYHCAFCKRAVDIVQDLTTSDPDVKVVFREFPILREESQYAAEIALAAREQGKYRDLHFALMKTKGVMPPDRVNAIARSAGLNVRALESARKDPSIAAAIGETYRIADEMGVEGTPAFVVATLDGDYVRVVSGYYPNELAAAIKEAKAAAGTR
ncbi:MAG: DsbA family protein [Parvularculaceae bacterium]